MHRRLIAMPRALVLLGILALSTPATAGLSNFLFLIEVTTPQGNGSWQAPYDPAGWIGDTYTWTLAHDIPITSPTGKLLATVQAQTTSLRVIADPVVSLNFDVVAGASNTNFLISSALLSFPTIAAAQGKASAGITATDLNGDGVVRTGGYLTSTKSYLAQTNGLAGTESGTTFAQLVDNASNPAAFSTDVESGELGFVPIAGAVSDMSTAVKFTLSANDSASGTSVFVVQPIPEPATGLLISLALPATLMRRRR